MNRRCLEHDQPDTAPRPRLVVGDELVGWLVVVDERRLVCGRDDPVPELHGPERKRTEEPVRHYSASSSAVRSASDNGRDRPSLPRAAFSP